MVPSSADSHVVESANVFAVPAERFGDAAPRVMRAGTLDDAIVIPAKGHSGIRKCMGCAGLRVRERVAIERRSAYKPEVDRLTDDVPQVALARGNDGLRPGIRDGAFRGEDQDIEGVSAEFLYPGSFGLFAFENIELPVACQKYYNDWLVVAEFNAGWIAFWLDRIDQALQWEAHFRGEAFIGERPSEVWRRQFHATLEDDRPTIATRADHA